MITITLFMINSFGINGDVLQQCMVPHIPVTFSGEDVAGEGLLEQQHLPGPNTYLQALLVSKPVPNSPLRDPVLAVVVLEGPKSSDHPSHSYQQPVSGQGLGGAPSSTSQDWDAGLFPWEPSNTASLQACSPAGMESGRGSPAVEQGGWMPAWSLFPPSPCLNHSTKCL